MQEVTAKVSSVAEVQHIDPQPKVPAIDGQSELDQKMWDALNTPHALGAEYD